MTVFVHLLPLFQTPLCPAVCAGMRLGTEPGSPQAPLSVCLKSSRPLISALFIIKRPYRANSFLQVGDADASSKIINIQISTICQDEFGFVSFQGVSLCSHHFPVVLLNSQFSPAVLQRSRMICRRLGTQWRVVGPIPSPTLPLRAAGRRGPNPGLSGDYLSNPHPGVCGVNRFILPFQSKSAWRDFGRSCLSSEVTFEEASWSEPSGVPLDHFCFLDNNVASHLGI